MSKMRSFTHILWQSRKSVWCFPVLLSIIFAGLVILGINGSSIGNYHEIFNGGKDKSLIFNQPRGVRTDEWIVSTPLVISQEKNHYNPINHYIGSGEDVSLLGDVPYRDWSIVFKPQNSAFLVLPFDNAFSFRWWGMAYLLLLAAYFFAYLFLPAKLSKKALLSAFLSVSLFFSPFLQWWYTTGALAPITYTLFGLSAILLLLRAKRLSHVILLGIFLFYVAVCFCLVLYPPFQIPCALVAAIVSIGLLLEHKKHSLMLPRLKILTVVGSILLTLATVGLFFYQHRSVVDTIGSSSYPGHRVATSGGVSIRHFSANHLARLFVDDKRANAYGPFMGKLTNQSEASNFILTLPFTSLILLVFTIKSFRQRKKPYVSLAILIMTSLFGAWLFIPGLDSIGKVTLLDKVPPIRLLIGIGLLNFLAFLEAIRILVQQKRSMSLKWATALAVGMFMCYLAFNLYTHHIIPEFIGIKWAVILAIPIPIAIFFLLRRNFALAAFVLMLFTFLSTYQVNPLYQGTTSLRNTDLSQAIQKLSRTDKRYWISENMISVNLITMSGARSLSGTYLYPQNDIWKEIDSTDSSIYNRYANVLFMLDRNKDVTIQDHIKAIGDDQFWVEIEPCSPTLKRIGVGFITTVSPFSSDIAPCLTLVDRVTYPTASFFIYKIR